MFKLSTVSILLLFAIIVSIGGCNGSSGSNSSRPVQYPSTWPIKTLTVPAGVKQIPLHDMYDSSTIKWERNGEINAQGEAQERKRWEISFEPGLSGKEVADHIDSCLKPLGFMLFRDGTPPDNTRMYISKDKKIQVNLDFLDFAPIKMAGKSGWKGYRLTAAVWSRPRPDTNSPKPIP